MHFKKFHSTHKSFLWNGKKRKTHADVGVPANMPLCGITSFPIPLYQLIKNIVNQINGSLKQSFRLPKIKDSYWRGRQQWPETIEPTEFPGNSC
jgi:hypothetical protein